ncbi:MAG: putative DNA binding domain-containing protein [Verrucomicrobiota bacterium]|jgi:ATP-dependent DNA helicase RecG|nr:putative DNA binding domain-containing protein [Verrucomicrobiota bacterium]
MMTTLPTEQANALLDALLDSSETQTLETKRVSGKMVGRALETVCAFANTRGGSLFLGVEDAGKAAGVQRLYGVEENPEAVDELVRILKTQLLPEVDGIAAVKIPCTLRDGKAGFLVRVFVPQSAKVHSLRDDGTWMRGQASNREMSASEITELSYQRGVRSAESEPVDIDFELLETETWRLFLHHRGLTDTGIANQLYRIGLAKKVDGELRPVRAAVLLFADFPGNLLAATGTRADVRVFHYHGTAVEHGATPNLKKPPKTLSGPIFRLIEQTNAYVLNELAGGLTLSPSGFKTVHRYPERVVREAITNAVIHRDYRLNRDVQIRIFDDRIEVASPGLFPGRVTAGTIQRAESFARNPLIVSNLREFPEPPNVDAGEGVQMMFALMRAENRYPPIYQECWESESGKESVTVKLLNEERPPIWEQVADWIDHHGPISNHDLREIAHLDTLKASKLLMRWVEQGTLLKDSSLGKRNMVYRKPVTGAESLDVLLSSGLDNKRSKSHNLIEENEL